MESQLSQYVPVMVLGAVALAIAAGGLVFSVLAGKKGRRSAIKDTAYECGMIPEGTAGARMSVKFYLVAMLFILFDIEVVFLYPWAVVYVDMLKRNAASAVTIFGAMISFLGILFVGYIYAYRKGAFDWND